MNAVERAGFLAHAQTAAFERKVEQAENVIRQWFSRCKKPYVAFSAGKDSTVVLDLARKQQPETVAMFCDEEWLLPETIELVEHTENLVRIAKRDEHTEWFTAWENGRPDELPPGTLWAENGFRSMIEGWGYDGAAVGLRGDENRMRKIHIRKFGEYFQLKRGVWQCYPLAWWSDMDVWSFIVTRGLNYNSAYDVLAAIGVPLRERRIGPMAVEGPARRGAMAHLKQGWPELFNRFAEKHPVARRYV